MANKLVFLVSLCAAGAIVVTQASEHPIGNAVGQVFTGLLTQGSTTVVQPGYALLLAPASVNMVTDEIVTTPARPAHEVVSLDATPEQPATSSKSATDG
jgi:hypothetical protein